MPARATLELTMRRVFYFAAVFVWVALATDTDIEDDDGLPRKCAWFDLCFDEDPLCPQLARNGSCFGAIIDPDGMPAYDPFEAVRVLAKCRPSCRKEIEERTAKGMNRSYRSRNAWIRLCRLFQGNLTYGQERSLFLAGGTNDFYQDPLGRVFHICSVADGFTYAGRVAFLGSFTVASIAFFDDRFRWPRYTEVGFKKAKAPPSLFGDILDVYATMQKQRLFKRGTY